jgi:hypothetical protein
MTLFPMRSFASGNSAADDASRDVLRGSVGWQHRLGVLFLLEVTWVRLLLGVTRSFCDRGM